MMTVFILQTVLPSILILWLAFLPPRNMLGFWMLVVAATAMTLAVAKLGIWVFPPWWVPYLMALLLVCAIVWRLILPARRPFLPNGASGWLTLVACAGIAGFGMMEVREALAAAVIPEGPSVSLAWPLGPGIYLVANGGASAAINAHAALLDPSHALHAGFGGSGYGVDLIAVNRWGLRASSMMPRDPGRYLIFGTPVLAPCAGQVILAAAGQPDMQVPEMDEANPAGNHVLLRCDGIDVLLAHFRQGSLRVAAGERLAAGQQIAEVGNSGETSEPHLHIHAQMPGKTGAPFAAAPVAMRLEGRFLVRGDLIDRPARAP